MWKILLCLGLLTLVESGYTHPKVSEHPSLNQRTMLLTRKCKIAHFALIRAFATTLFFSKLSQDCIGTATPSCLMNVWMRNDSGGYIGQTCVEKKNCLGIFSTFIMLLWHKVRQRTTTIPPHEFQRLMWFTNYQIANHERRLHPNTKLHLCDYPAMSALIPNINVWASGPSPALLGDQMRAQSLPIEMNYPLPRTWRDATWTTYVVWLSLVEPYFIEE